MADSISSEDLEKSNSPEPAPAPAGTGTGRVAFGRSLTIGPRQLTLREEFEKRTKTIGGSESTGVPLLSREQTRTIESLHHVDVLRGPPRPNPITRIPTTFRTLSIDVTETREQVSTIGKAKKTKKVSEIADLDWQLLPVEEVAQRLSVSPNVGLDAASADRKLQQSGRNVISHKRVNWPKKIFWWIFGGFGSLLFIAAIICFVAWKPLGEPAPQISNLALAVVLLIVIGIQAVFNAWQDWSTSRVMSSIGALIASEVLVLRDGSVRQMAAADLVPGDVIKMKQGGKVPADVRLIEASSDLKFDRSILTGESEPISGRTDKSEEGFMEASNVALQGTLCVSGTATAIVVLTGDKTVFGTIAHLTSRDNAVKTTLEVEILRFVFIIASLAVATGLLIIILWAAWLRKDHPNFLSVSGMLVDVISVLVAFIPEGLPISVTLSLTIVANKMKNAKVLCKSLTTVETLGAVNIICSDKTGTLTTAQMTVTETVVLDTEYSVDHLKSHIKEKGKHWEALNALGALASICNDAQFEEGPAMGGVEKVQPLPSSIRKVNGDATDTALLRFSDSVDPVDQTRNNWHSLFRLAFNSKNKFAAVLARPAQSDSRPLPFLSSDKINDGDMCLLVKGGPDVLVKRCTTILDLSGQVVPLDEERLKNLVGAQEALASRGRRVVMLARKIVPSHALDKEVLANSALLADKVQAMNEELTVVGLTALVDPPKYDTAETVRICRLAGIRFCMVTGDFALTAAAIAREVGIITSPMDRIHYVKDLPRDTPIAEIPAYEVGLAERPRRSLVLSGSDLLHMSDAQWKWATTYQELVFARTTPEQKLRIVRTFQGEGAVVAVTGDGTNDSPALRAADIGIAIAGGSEVAMEAADLVLLEDFSAIITAIELGRLVFDNLKKVIVYLLPAGSFSELWPVLISVLFGLPQALSSLQMIIICVLTDPWLALCMIYEQPEDDLLRRPPRDTKKDRLANLKLMTHAYLFLGLIESITSMAGAFYFGYQRMGVPFSALWLSYGNVNVDPDLFAEATNKAQSIYFYNLIIMQIFNLLATRTRRLSILQQPPFFSKRTQNWRILPAVIISIGIGTFLSYLPWFQSTFLTRGVSVEFWFLPVAYGVGILLLDECRKLAVRSYPNSFLAKIAW